MGVINYIGLVPVLLSILNTACCENQNCSEVYTENGVKKTKVFECHDGCCGDIEDRYCCEEENVMWMTGVIIPVILTIVVVVIVMMFKRWQCRQRQIEKRRSQVVPGTRMHKSNHPPPTYNEATTQQNYPGPQTNSGQQNNYYASKDYKMGSKGYPVQSSFPPTYSAFGGVNPSWSI